MKQTRKIIGISVLALWARISTITRITCVSVLSFSARISAALRLISAPLPHAFVSLPVQSTSLGLFTINKRSFSTANALSLPGRIDPGLVSKFSDNTSELEIKEAQENINKKVEDYKDRTNHSPEEIETSSREAFDACASKKEADALYTEKKNEITGNSAKFAEEVKSDVADVIKAMEQSHMTRESCEKMKQEQQENLVDVLQAENELTCKQLDALNEGYDYSLHGEFGGGNYKSDNDEDDNEGGQAIKVSQGEGLSEPSQDSTEPASNRSFTKFNTTMLWLKLLKYVVKALSGDDEQEHDDY